MKRSSDVLKAELSGVLSGPLLSPEITIAACGRLSEKIRSGHIPFPPGFSAGREDLEKAACLLDADRLRDRMDRELGAEGYGTKWLPLGILLHIGAGNVPGLGAYSVMEGLLTGNINLLKPASCDYPVSRFLLRLLAEEEPRLAPYIHIFRIPSSCPEKLRKLARMADAAVIWGGMDAVRSVRSLLSPGQKLIEWGHKISFAYVTMEGASKPLDLFRLARHMFLTQGRYCSSCQGIFLDTDRPEDLRTFCGKFRKLYESCASLREDPEHSLSETAGKTLNSYCASMKTALDAPLSASAGGCWIRLLPRNRMAESLRDIAPMLQTACLICSDHEKDTLSYLLLRSGISRVCSAGQLSDFSDYGQIHDGEYALRRYCKIISL